jgi:cytochrome c-type biogenesis protein CcmH/NrfF
MSNPNDDPALAAFLSKQSKPAASAEEIAKLGEHTSRNPPKRSGDVAIWGGGSIFVVLIVLRIVTRVLRADNQPADTYSPEPPPAAISPAEQQRINAVLQKMNQLERSKQAEESP